MAQAPQQRVLVYDRIDANRRATRRLLVAFSLVLLPVAAYLATYLMLWVAMILGILLAGFGVADVFSEGNLWLWMVLIAGIAVAILLLVAYLQFVLAARLVLRAARAKPVGEEEEPELRRAVENLCIGSGLPQPAMYVIESPAANALATGLEPERSAVAVTRGLLGLLAPAELEAVLAHEMSQIGNYDTRLATVLAAGVGLLRLPAVIVIGFFRFLFRIHWAVGGGLLLYLGLPILATIPLGITLGVDLMEEEPEAGVLLITAMFLPVYVFVAAPFIAHLLRLSVVRRRRFLADADAVLLARNAEPLATALTKMAGAGTDVRAGAATAHLYIADPMPGDAPWWDGWFPSHPPLAERIEAIGAMGGALPPAILERALKAGSSHRREANAIPPLTAGGDTSRALLDEEAPPDEPEAPLEAYRLTTAGVALYERPDAASAELARLAAGALVTVIDRADGFLHVLTSDDRFGYILEGAGMTRVEVHGQRPG